MFGASGQIGAALLPLLRAAGDEVFAVSRTMQAGQAGVLWLRGDLDAAAPVLPPRLDVIYSLGPLDAFARWFARGAAAPRVVAFGSTSVHTKLASPDPAERALAVRLHQAEDMLNGHATQCGVAVTLLRPTLIYGAGRDRTLSRVAALGRRFGAFPLPRGACGLRQPVHVADLAQAAQAVAAAASTAGRSYALPGGETLPYRDMVARTLAALRPPARLVELPAPLFEIAQWLAVTTGRRGPGAGVLQRMREDLVFDADPARRDFGYAPRRFAPIAADLSAPHPTAPRRGRSDIDAPQHR